MKENLGDVVLDKLHERRRVVKDRLAKQYKGTKPFRMEPMPEEMNLYIYGNMAREDLDYAINTYGRDAVNQWMYESEMAKQRRKK